MPGQNIKRPLKTPTPIQQNVDIKIQDLDSTEKMQMTCPEEDQLNETIITLSSGQQDLQKQSFNMMQNMTGQHEYDNLMRDNTIYDRKKHECS